MMTSIARVLMLMLLPMLFAAKGCRPMVLVDDQNFLSNVVNKSSTQTSFTLKLTNASNATHYSFKVVSGEKTLCQNLNNYSGKIDLSQLLGFNIAQFANGPITLCLLGHKKVGSGFTSAKSDEYTGYTWSKTSITLGSFNISGPASPINTLRPMISWQVSQGATAYDVIISELSGCQSAVVFYTNVTATSLVVDRDLVDDRDYYVCVNAKSGAVVKTASNNGFGFRVDLGSQPTELGEFRITDPINKFPVLTLRPTIRWTASAGANRYDVRLSRDPQRLTTAVSYTNLTATQITINQDLENDKTYYLEVIAKNGNLSKQSVDNGNAFIIHQQVIFTTSQAFSVGTNTATSFNSLASADAKCTAAANASGLNANAGNQTWKALLSDDNTNAKDRIIIRHAMYTTTSNELIAVNKNDLWDGDIENAIRFSEFGLPVPFEADVWTGTGIFGFRDVTCRSWTNGTASESGITGDSYTIFESWIEETGLPCNSSFRLYCINQF